MEFEPGVLRRWLGAAAVLSFLVFATAAASQEVTAGVRAGANFSTVRYQNPNANEQTELKPGFHLGASVAVALSRHLDGEASLLFSQGGYGGRGGHPWDVEMDYLEVPLTVRLKLPWSISPHLTAGLTTRFQLRCRLVDVAVVGETTCDDPVVGRGWRETEVLAIGGLGASTGVGPGILLLEAQIGWGLTNINYDPLPPGWVKSADLRISSAFRLPVG